MPPPANEVPVWIAIEGGVRFRSAPRTGDDTWIERTIFQRGARLLSLDAEGAPDANGVAWLPVRAPNGREGFIAARSGAVPFITRDDPTIARRAVFVATAGLRLRSEPRVADETWLDRITLPQGTRLTAFGEPGALDANGRTWQRVRTVEGRDGFVAASEGDTRFLADTPPVPPWPFGKALAGLHRPADPFPFADGDYNTVRVSRVEAVKLLSAGDGAPGHGAVSVNKLREIDPEVFLLARIFEKPGERRMTAPDFVQATRAGISELYDAGVRYFEVHNEPNLSLDGLGLSWRNGMEFNDWFRQVVSLLRQDPGLRDARWGFPGCSPGPGFEFFSPAHGRVVARQTQWGQGGFLQQCEQAIGEADWIGVHCYWRDDAGMRSEQDGMGWKWFRERWPGKLLFITEFSNNNREASLEDKGRQYAEYYRQLRREPGLGAAFCYVLFWQPEADENHESWRNKRGTLNSIPALVGEAVPGLA